MRGDQHIPGRSAGQVVDGSLARPVGGEAFEGERVVDELTQNGHGPAGRERLGLFERVAHPEAKPVVFCKDDFHELIASLELL